MGNPQPRPVYEYLNKSKVLLLVAQKRGKTTLKTVIFLDKFKDDLM